MCVGFFGSATAADPRGDDRIVVAKAWHRKWTLEDATMDSNNNLDFILFFG